MKFFLMVCLLLSSKAMAADFTVEFSPSANSVGNAQILDGSISQSKIQGLGALASKNSLVESDIPSLSISKILGLGSFATKNNLVEMDIPTLSLSKIQGLGPFASKSNLEVSDIPTLPVSKVSGLGSLATKNSLLDSDIPSLLSSKISDLVSVVTDLINSAISVKLTPVAFSATHSAGQSINNNLDSVVVFNVERYDTHNAYNPLTGAFLVPENGKYKCYCLTAFASFSPGSSSIIISITKNGNTSVQKYLTTVPTANVWGNDVALSDVYVMGDTIRCNIYQNTGSARSLTSSTSFHNFSCEKVAN